MLCVVFFPKGPVEDRILLVFSRNPCGIANIWSSQTSEADIIWLSNETLQKFSIPTDREVTQGFFRQIYERDTWI